MTFHFKAFGLFAFIWTFTDVNKFDKILFLKKNFTLILML